MRLFILILFFILPLEIFADEPEEQFITVDENDKEFTSDTSSSSTEKVKNTDARKGRKYRRQRNRSGRHRQESATALEKRDSSQSDRKHKRQGRGKNRRMDKFVDKDGDGINDNRCRGTGLQHRKGKGRRCGKHCRNR